MPYNAIESLAKLANAKIQIPKDFKATENTCLAIQWLHKDGILNQECFDVINCCYSTDTMHYSASCLLALNNAEILTSKNAGYFRTNPQNAGVFAHILHSMLENTTLLTTLAQDNFDTLCSLDVTQVKMVAYIMFTCLTPAAVTQENFNLLCSNHEYLTDILAKDPIMHLTHCESRHQLGHEEFSKLVEEVLAAKAKPPTL